MATSNSTKYSKVYLQLKQEWKEKRRQGNASQLPAYPKHSLVVIPQRRTGQPGKTKTRPTAAKAQPHQPREDGSITKRVPGNSSPPKPARVEDSQGDRAPPPTPEEGGEHQTLSSLPLSQASPPSSKKPADDNNKLSSKVSTDNQPHRSPDVPRRPSLQEQTLQTFKSLKEIDSPPRSNTPVEVNDSDSSSD